VTRTYVNQRNVQHHSNLV